jgi:tRNA threonylcarbamoyladenosine biosynthesis protein TsaE
MKRYITKNPSETQKVGMMLGKEVLKKKKKRIIALEGDLGGGKTTFLKGFAKGLGIKEKILSQSFIIFRRFRLRHPFFKNFYHFDCYRIENEKEILKLGFRKIIKDPKNVVAIEWKNRIKKILPKETLSIEIKIIGEKKREILIKNG